MSDLKPESCIVCGEPIGWDDDAMVPACRHHFYGEVFEAADKFGGGNKASKTQQGGSHYCARDIQPIDYALANNFNYWESAALKYLTRHRDKHGSEDLRKAIHCIELGLEREYGE